MSNRMTTYLLTINSQKTIQLDLFKEAVNVMLNNIYKYITIRQNKIIIPEAVITDVNIFCRFETGGINHRYHCHATVEVFFTPATHGYAHIDYEKFSYDMFSILGYHPYIYFKLATNDYKKLYIMKDAYK